MNFSLTPNLEQFVRDKAKSGDYNNASEVIREAIRLFKCTEEENAIKITHFRKVILQGDEAVNRGESITLKSEQKVNDFFAAL